MRSIMARWAARLLSFVLALGFGMASAEAPPMVAIQVSPNVYYVQGLAALGNSSNQNFISNAGFIVGKTGVVVIDGLGSPAVAERLMAEIRRVTDLPVTHVIVTHYHADHVYGLQVFKDQGATILAHDSAKLYLNSADAQTRLAASRRDMAPWVNDDTRLVFADEWLNAAESREMAGLRVQIDPVGPAHTPDDLAIWVPSEGVLFSGDLIFNGRLPFVGKADSSQWIKSLEHLMTYDAQAVVPGHGKWSNDPRKDIGMVRDYLKFLRQTMGEAARDLIPFEEAYDETDWRDWQSVPMFKFANRMNAYNTYLLMEQEALKAQ